MIDDHNEHDDTNKDQGTTDTGTTFVKTDEDHIRRINMTDQGKLITSKSTAAALPGTPRLYIAAGWILAALTAFIWPYFAILGVVAGTAANIKSRGSGNAIIITNIVFAAVNILFWYFIRSIV